MEENNRPKKAGKGGTGTSAWMVTFSDLSTLLLTFFVLLLSMSSMDDRTLKSMFTNFTASCGILLFKEYGEIYKPKDVLIEGLYEQLKDTLVVKRATESSRDFVSQMDEKIFERTGGIMVENFEDGFKLVFGHQLLFETGRAEIKAEAKPILDKIVTFIEHSAYQIYIDGHTDSTPIHTDLYPSNEALSFERAYNILNYFVKDRGISPQTMALIGYGEMNPIQSNETASGRAANRRVEMIFKNQKYF